MYLDDLKYIHARDTADTLGIVEKQGKQLLHDFEVTDNTSFKNVHNIVYGGIGGSALAPSIVNAWLGQHKPLEIVRDYDLPAYVGADTLFIAASSSGNTEETLSALKQAEARGAQVAVITGGGTLQAVAEEKGYLLLQLPKVGQPRYAALYNLKALLLIMEKAGLLTKDFRPELERAVAFLESARAPWRPDVPTAKNPAKQLAQELMGQSVVVYSGPKLFPAAYKWKISINENAKQLAWTNYLPELSHNEFIGWSQQPLGKPYAVVELRSTLEHSRVQKRFEVTERLLSGRRPAPHIVDVKGETILEQLLWTVMYGDFVSIYLGLLNGLDPAPTALVDTFKKEMEKH